MTHTHTHNKQIQIHTQNTVMHKQTSKNKTIQITTHINIEAHGNSEREDIEEEREQGEREFLALPLAPSSSVHTSFKCCK